jgi:hypothetical protein
MGAHGELGVGYRWGDRAGFDTVLGAELGLSATAFALHFDVMRPEISPSAGFVIPPVSLRLSQSCWIAGRPQRAEHGYAPLPALALSEWSLQAGGRDVRAALHATVAAKPADLASDRTSDRFEEYGIASNAQHEAIAEAQRQRALQRLDKMLAT